MEVSFNLDVGGTHPRVTPVAVAGKRNDSTHNSFIELEGESAGEEEE